MKADFVMTNLNGEALDLPVVYDAECGYYTLNGKSYRGKAGQGKIIQRGVDKRGYGIL